MPMSLDAFPADVLRILVYSSGLTKVCDRISLLMSCKTVLNACGGCIRTKEERFQVISDGGEAHWRKENEIAGYLLPKKVPSLSGPRQIQGARDRQLLRALFFDKKSLRCACCDMLISHRTGRISTTGYQGRGVRLSTCVQCGPLIHSRSSAAAAAAAAPLAPDLTQQEIQCRVFGCYSSRRQVDSAIMKMKAAEQQARWDRRKAEVQMALLHTCMGQQAIDKALVGSVAYGLYVFTVQDDGVGLRETLDGTVLNICRRHWMNTYTWLPCAGAMCGTPCTDATKDDMYEVVLACYGGYPTSWPWSPSPDQMVVERQKLADIMVTFYADNMMLDALFRRLLSNDLYWLGDHAWLHRIRDAAVRLGPSKGKGNRSGSRLKSRVTFVVPLALNHPAVDVNNRVAQLMLEADFVGGYRVGRNTWHATFTVT